MAVSQLKSGVVLNYFIIGLQTLVGLLYTPFLLRMLGQSEYGLYSLVASVIGYLTIMDFGFGNAVIRYTAKYRAEGKVEQQYSLFGMFLKIYCVIGVVAIAFGMVLYLNVDNLFGGTMTAVELSEAKIMMLILTFNLAITFPFSVFGSIITSYEDFIFQKMVQIVRIVLNTVVMICLLKMGYKAIAMVVVQTVFNLMTLLINAFYCKYKIKIKFVFGKINWSLLKEVSIYSFWIFLNVIIDKVYWSTGQFVLGAVAGTVAVAVFAVAIRLTFMYMSFSTAIASVFLPRISGMEAKKCPEKEISDIFIRTGRLQYAVLSFVLSGFVIFGRRFIALWAGPGYEDSYIMTLLFFLALLIPMIQNVGITILQARNQMKFRSLMYLAIAALSLVAQIVLAKKFGGIGCAVAIAGALFLGTGLIMNVYYHVKQHLDIVSFWKEILKMSVVPLVLTLLSFWALNYVDINSLWMFLIAVLVYSALYVPLFWRLSLKASERELILRPLRKLSRGEKL